MIISKVFKQYQKKESTINPESRDLKPMTKKYKGVKTGVLLTPAIFGIVAWWSILMEGLFIKELLTGYFILGCLLLFRGFQNRNVKNKLKS